MDDQSILTFSPDVLMANLVCLMDEQNVLTVAQFVLTDDCLTVVWRFASEEVLTVVQRFTSKDFLWTNSVAVSPVKTHNCAKPLLTYTHDFLETNHKKTFHQLSMRQTQI